MHLPLPGSFSPLGRSRTAAAVLAATLATLPGCKALWQTDSLLYSDTAGTTPATADGTAVQRIGDQSGNGKHGTFAGTAPLLKTGANGINGKPVLEFTNDNVNNHTILNDTFNAGLTIHFVIQSSNSGGLQVAALLGTSGYIGDRANNAISFYMPPVINAELGLIIPASAVGGGLWCGSARYTGANFDVWINGEVIHSSARTGSPGYVSTGSFFQIGKYNGGGFGWTPGKFGAIGLYNTAHTDAEMRTAQRTMHRYINRTVAQRLIVIGDSISVNSGNDNWTVQLTNALNSASTPYALYNNSHAGYTINDPAHDPLYALLSSETYPDFHWLTGPNWDGNGHIVLLTAGSNDLLYGASAATTLSRQQQMIDAIRSYWTANGLGGLIGVGTVQSRTDFGSSQEAARVAYNAGVLGGSFTGADFTLDFASIPGMTYLDGVHPDTAGYTKMKNYALPIIQAADPY